MEFLAGVGVTILGFLPGFLLLFFVARQAMRKELREHTVAEAWRVAATNATIMARVYETLQEKKQDEDTDKVVHGG